MNYRELFIHKKEDFERVWSLITNAIAAKRELPDQVFNQFFSGFALEEYDWAMSIDFWETLQKLTLLAGDSEVYMAILNPDSPNYFLSRFGYYNIASLPMTMSKDDYWRFVDTNVYVSPYYYSVLTNTEIVAWFPPSLKWFIFGERSYSVLILAFSDEETKKAAEPITNTWIPMDDMLGIIGLNFSQGRVVPKEFEEAFRKNYENK